MTRDEVIDAIKEWADSEPPEEDSHRWQHMAKLIDLLNELGPALDSVIHWDVNIGNKRKDKGSELMITATKLAEPDPILYPVDSIEYSTLVTNLRDDAYNFAERLKNLLEEAKSEMKPDAGYDHSHDYRAVVWNGQPFSFNPTQAKIIKHLWESETPIHQNSIAAVINSTSEQYRPIYSFRAHGKTHPAYSAMIKNAGNGLYTLKNKPQS